MTLSTHDVATELGIDDRAARRFLRSISPKHEANHQWAIKDTEVSKLKLLYLVQRLGTDRVVKILEENGA